MLINIVIQIALENSYEHIVVRGIKICSVIHRDSEPLFYTHLLYIHWSGIIYKNNIIRKCSPISIVDILIISIEKKFEFRPKIRNKIVLKIYVSNIITVQTNLVKSFFISTRYNTTFSII